MHLLLALVLAPLWNYSPFSVYSKRELQQVNCTSTFANTSHTSRKGGLCNTLTLRFPLMIWMTLSYNSSSSLSKFNYLIVLGKLFAKSFPFQYASLACTFATHDGHNLGKLASKWEDTGSLPTSSMVQDLKCHVPFCSVLEVCNVNCL